MAQKPTKSQGARTFNIIERVRGNFDIKSKADDAVAPMAYAAPELISSEDRRKLLGGLLRQNVTQKQPVQAGSLLSIVQGSVTKTGQERIENRKILDLMPDVDKAARLMIASIFSPNDLTREEIPVVFNNDTIKPDYKKRLDEFASTFFQKKMNLKTQAPSWVYQFGYESGSAVFAMIPMASFDKIHDEAYIGTESFSKNVIDPIAQESLFDFGDGANDRATFTNDVLALESLATQTLLNEDTDEKNKRFQDNKVPSRVTSSMVEKFIAQEALSLTDNPSILRVQKHYKVKAEKKTQSKLNARFKTPMVETMVSLDLNGDEELHGNPIMMRLPPESVTVIHTPGDPNDHQGYLVLLDQLGNPINAVVQEEARQSSPQHFNNNHQSIFQQTYNAYGINATANRNMMDHEAMGRVYTHIVTEHLKRRLGKAGFNHVEMENLDSVYRCMFSRFLQQKHTRILFLPKDLVTYMTFEMDQHGYGVSRLDGIKFTLGMKMSLQVSRVLAAIKAAMDRRKIEVKFDSTFMDQPEQLFNSVIDEYIKKQIISFTVDPTAIQNQIADKSISIKGSGIPGMEDFDITNEPDTRNTNLEIDPEVEKGLDKTILNGLKVPASTMNSLSEDEYARSVTTTNLFFAMDVAIDQEVVTKCISDVLRKYGRFSEEFQKGILEILPQLNKGKIKGKSSTDETESTDKDDEGSGLADNYTLEMLLDEMSIALPHPNVAPNKAQFEALEAMVSAITATVTALLPDECIGSDESLRPVLQVLRAQAVVENIRTYLKSSGMSSLKVPENEVASSLSGIKTFHDSLYNLAELMKDNAKIANPEPAMPTDPSMTDSTPTGYEP